MDRNVDQDSAVECTAAPEKEEKSLYVFFCFGASISIGREIRCLQYAGFFLSILKIWELGFCVNQIFIICMFKDKNLAENWTNLAENLKKIKFCRTHRTRFLQLGFITDQTSPPYLIYWNSWTCLDISVSTTSRTKDCSLEIPILTMLGSERAGAVCCKLCQDWKSTIPACKRLLNSYFQERGSAGDTEGARLGSVAGQEQGWE